MDDRAEGEKYGAIDRIYDLALEATLNIPDGPLHAREFMYGFLSGTDLIPAIYESDTLRRESKNTEQKRRESYTIGNKARWKMEQEFIDRVPTVWGTKNKNGKWVERAENAGVVAGFFGPGLTALATKEPAFLLFYGTNATDAANFIDRNYLTGELESWEEVDEKVENAYEEVKETFGRGIEFVGNAKDNIIRDARTWIEHLGSDQYLEFHDPEIEEFWDAARQLENHGEITGIEYAYNSHPEELEIREIEEEINSMIEEDHLRVTREDFTIEEVKGENGNSRKPGKTYNLKIEAEMDINDIDSKVEVDQDRIEKEVLELSVRWPANYPDPRLFGKENGQVSAQEREAEPIEE